MIEDILKLLTIIKNGILYKAGKSKKIIRKCFNIVVGCFSSFFLPLCYDFILLKFNLFYLILKAGSFEIKLSKL